MPNMRELWKDEDFRARMSARMKKRWQDPAIRQSLCKTISESNKIAYADPEKRKQLSLRNKKVANDPKFSEKRLLSFQKTILSDAHKEKMITVKNKASTRWNDQTYRERITQSVRNSWTVERKTIVGKKAKLRFADGTFVRKMWQTRLRNKIIREMEKHFGEFKENGPTSLEKERFFCTVKKHTEELLQKTTKLNFFEIISALNKTCPFSKSDPLRKTYSAFLSAISQLVCQKHNDLSSVKIRTGCEISHATTRSEMEKEFQKIIEKMTSFPAKFIPEYGDITFLDQKVVVDVDGDIYHASANWHSSAVSIVTKNYHFLKVKQARENGFRPIRFWGHEIEKRKQQCANYVATALGFGKHIHTKDCVAQKISTDRAKEIVSLWAVQKYTGSDNVSAYTLSTKNDGEPIAIILFEHPTKKFKKRQVFVSRICTAPGIQIFGGWRLLFSYAENELASDYDEIIAFSHNRFSNGNLYKRMGFSFQKALPPDYHYIGTYSSKVLKKDQATKNKLKKKLFSIGVSFGLAESEELLAARLRLSRCYDAGRICWRKSLH